MILFKNQHGWRRPLMQHMKHSRILSSVQKCGPNGQKHSKTYTTIRFVGAQISESMRDFYIHPIHGPARRAEASKNSQKRFSDPIQGPALRAKISKAG